jgi:hypothetical protein
MHCDHAVIEMHENEGNFKEWRTLACTNSSAFLTLRARFHNILNFHVGSRFFLVKRCEAHVGLAALRRKLSC